MGYYSCDFCFLKVTEYLRIYKKEPGALFLFVKIPTNNTYDYCEVKNILERGWWMIFFGEMSYSICKDEKFILCSL